MNRIATTSTSTGTNPGPFAPQADPAEIFFLAVRKLSHVAISTSEMKTNLTIAERNESETMNQQPKQTSKTAVRNINPAAISSVKNMNTTTTTISASETGECGRATQSDARPDINTRQQPHAERAERVVNMRQFGGWRHTRRAAGVSPNGDCEGRFTQQHLGQRRTHTPQEICVLAVRNLSQVAISPTEMNTTTTISVQTTGECECTAKSDARPTQQAATAARVAVAEQENHESSERQEAGGRTSASRDHRWIGTRAGGANQEQILQRERRCNNMSESNVSENPKRFGVEVNNLVELQSSTPAHRQFRFKFKAKGFVFWASAEQTENGWVVTWPWPKVCRIEKSNDQTEIEVQVAARLTEELTQFESVAA